MRLIGNTASPYVRKVRIFCLEKKIDFELIPENVFSPDTRIAQYNPLGKVPCLLLDDDSTLFDSRVIIEYIDGLNTIGTLIPTAGRERTAVKCWEALADGILDAGVLIRLETVLRPEALRSADEMARQWKKVNAGLAMVVRDLGTNEFCSQQRFTLADITLVSCLGWFDFRFPEFNWRHNYPSIATYFERISTRPSIAQTVPQ